MKEVVRPYNYKRLEILFKNGPDIYPGAEYIVKKDGQKYYIGNVNVTMEEGDILYRHLQDGDPVLMNRQPTLLPMSFGTHKIKVSERENHDTFDLNIMSND